MCRKRKRKPLGLMPLHLWEEEHPDPSLSELVARYTHVLEVVERHREVGAEPDPEWLLELGINYKKRVRR